MTEEQVKVQLWASATDDDMISIELFLGDEKFHIDLEVEDAKSWTTTIGKAVQDMVSRLPVADF